MRVDFAKCNLPPARALTRSFQFWLMLLACCPLQGLAQTGGNSSLLEDTPEPLETAVRSEAERDRLEAMALFGAGRMAQQRNDWSAALKSYQRALRLDPAATLVLREIVPLALSLERPGVAVRYALMAIESQPFDPVLLRRLAAFITEQGDNEKALKLYEKAAELFEKSPRKMDSFSVLMALEMGRLYFLDKRYEAAAVQFALVMKALDSPQELGIDEDAKKAILGNGSAVYRLFAEAFLEANRPDDALTAFTKANELHADGPQFALGKARVALLRGRVDDAEASLQECLGKGNADLGAAPYLLLEEILNKQDKKAELVPRLAKLWNENRENIDLGYFLANKYRVMGEAGKAVSIYQELLKTENSGPPVEAFQGLVAIYTEQNNVRSLYTILGNAAALTGSLDFLGASADALKKNRSMLSALLNRGQSAWDENSTKVTFGERLALAEVALANQSWQTADQWFERAMEARTERKAEPVLAWGFQLLLADRHESAARAFQRVLDEKLLPNDNAAAHYYLAGALEMDGKTEDALRIARDGARLQQDSPQFSARAAWILYHAKRYEDAKAEYLKVLEKFDGQHESEATRTAMRDARLILSNIAVHQNNLVEAEEWLEQILDEYPADIGALNDLGYLYADQGKKLHRALQMIQKAVEAEPKNPAYRDSLGWVLFRLERFAEAVEELQRAAEIDDSSDGVLQDHLGDALRATGQVQAAKEAYQKAVDALDKAGEAKKADEIRKKLSEQ